MCACVPVCVFVFVEVISTCQIHLIDATRTCSQKSIKNFVQILTARFYHTFGIIFPHIHNILSHTHIRKRGALKRKVEILFTFDLHSSRINHISLFWFRFFFVASCINSCWKKEEGKEEIEKEREKERKREREKKKTSNRIYGFRNETTYLSCFCLNSCLS